MVREERAKNPSTVYVANKNALPAVWSTVRNAAHGEAWPVLPNDGALRTTEVYNGNNQDTLVYPFSLAYLVFCL